METDLLSNHNVSSRKKLRYTSHHKEEADGYGFSTERIAGAVQHQFNKQASKAAKSFQNSDSKPAGDSDATELTKLRSRGSGTAMQSYTTETTSFQPLDVVYLERDILPSDTLQSFALLYGCTVNDLKRANNLINEQDFFALRRLKIPVKKHGLLTEPEEEVKRRPVATTSLLDLSDEASNFSKPSSSHLSNNRTSNDVYHLPNSDESAESNRLLLSNNKTALSKEWTIDCNDTGKFLKSVDKEIRKTIKMTDRIEFEKNEALEEVVSSLGSVGYRPLPLPSSKVNECDGASWGINFSTLMTFFVVVFVVILVFVAIFLIRHWHSSNQS